MIILVEEITMKTQLFTHMLYVSLKRISFSFLSFLHINKLSVLPPSLWLTASPPAADLLFRLPLIDVLQQCVSSGSVADGGPGEDGAAVRPKIKKTNSYKYYYNNLYRTFNGKVTWCFIVSIIILSSLIPLM